MPKKEIEDLVAEIRDCGYVVYLRGGHYHVELGDGQEYSFGSTPSDWRALMNIVTDLVQLGVLRPRREGKGTQARGKRPEIVPKPYEGSKRPRGRFRRFRRGGQD